MNSLTHKLYLGALFDLYGPLLTTKEQGLFHQYHFLDLSLSEIATNLLISKQAVSDALRNIERKLLNYEAKLGFYQKLGAKQNGI
ncbi:MAG: helix-turn-helix domain-containing protein [Erysipelotrichaceae bacterium]|jgi:predicted DNA-binding protein YlxM (UPF0122 family)|nr:helix-turn-helix domain-containing protein [Erysipelotrichaceae bacterium]